jgi:head-tail adaptor
MRVPQIGELNRRVTLRTRFDTPNDGFGISSEYQDVTKCWAKMEPIATAVYWGGVQTDTMGNRQREFISHRAIIRYRPHLDSNHELLLKERVYRVRRVSDLNDLRLFTVLELEELGDGEAGFLPAY